MRSIYPQGFTAINCVVCCDLRRNGEPCLWHITRDRTQETATRPLSIRKDGTWYCYGWDLTKNVCEVFKTNGGIGTTYSYTPYGLVTTGGSITQPLQWSSEFADTGTALTYYNYRHYNPTDGRWLSRDLANTNHPYAYVGNRLWYIDLLGCYDPFYGGYPLGAGIANQRTENDGKLSYIRGGLIYLTNTDSERIIDVDLQKYSEIVNYRAMKVDPCAFESDQSGTAEETLDLYSFSTMDIAGQEESM